MCILAHSTGLFGDGLAVSGHPGQSITRPSVAQERPTPVCQSSLKECRCLQKYYDISGLCSSLVWFGGGFGAFLFLSARCAC